jgi:hypothetical protein
MGTILPEFSRRPAKRADEEDGTAGSRVTGRSFHLLTRGFRWTLEFMEVS